MVYLVVSSVFSQSVVGHGIKKQSIASVSNVIDILSLVIEMSHFSAVIWT